MNNWTLASVATRALGDDHRLMIRYASVGAFTTLSGLGIQVLGHQVIGAPYLAAFIAAYVVMVSLAYPIHGVFVFRSPLSVAGFGRFHLVYIGQLLLGAVALTVMVELIGAPVLLAQGLTLLIGVVFSFVANRNFTFVGSR